MPGRIAYVLGTFPDSKNEYLVDAGLHPRFEYNLFLARNDADSITFDDLKVARSAWAKAWLKFDKPRYALAALVHERALKYDAIVASGEDVGLPIALGAMIDGLTTPIYVITHGSYFNSPKFRHLARLLRRLPSLNFMCLSASLKRILVDEYKIPSDRVHNSGYGIDTAFFTPRASELPPLIVSAGTAQRDYLTLVAASDGLGVDVKIAADSAWFPTSTDVDSGTLPPYVQARSYGDYTGLRDLYARAAFVVVPLYPARHACGYAVIAEAMAMGKAVITTRIDSESDFVIDGETGFYVEPGDVASLRSKMERLLTETGLASKMGDAARARMEANFSVEHYCERIEEIVC